MLVVAVWAERLYKGVPSKYDKTKGVIWVRALNDARRKAKLEEL